MDNSQVATQEESQEGHLKCLKSLSRSFRKGGRNLTQNARKRARVRPLLFLPLLQEEANAEQEETGGQAMRKWGPWPLGSVGRWAG